MTVRELIWRLKLLPPDAPVRILYDGQLRTDVEAAWLSRTGEVGLGPLDEPVYDDEDRTSVAPDGGNLTVKDMLVYIPTGARIRRILVGRETSPIGIVSEVYERKDIPDKFHRELDGTYTMIAWNQWERVDE